MDLKQSKQQCMGCEESARGHLAMDGFAEELGKDGLVQSEYFCSQHGVIVLTTLLSRTAEHAVTEES